MARTRDYGLGEFTYPRGWFAVAQSCEVGRAPFNVHYFGQDMAGRARFSQKRLSATAAYVDLARRYGLEVSTMALAFVRQKPFITSVLMAASNAVQLESNLKSLDVTLSKELMKEIDSLHDDLPNPR